MFRSALWLESGGCGSAFDISVSGASTENVVAANQRDCSFQSGNNVS